MKATISTVAVTLVLSFQLAFAPIVFAAESPLVPCGTESYPEGTIVPVTINGKVVNKDMSGMVSNPCGWADLIKLVGNITNYLIILGAAFSAVAFGWAGFMMMTAGGEMSKIEQAKSIFGKVLVGFLIMLSAWLIVRAIEAGFIKNTDFKSLLG